jgi:hypothetical protein
MADDTAPKSPSTAGIGGEIPGLKGLDEAAGKALTPAAEGFGKEIAPLGQRAGQITNRVGALLIRALEPLVYGLEKSADWIEKAVSERLKDVPQDKIVPPNPRIAVPALQALTYSLSDELIREMFANLLAADMNADTKKDAHPAFVELVKEMTPEDARILKLVQQSPRCAFTVRVGSSSRFLTIGTEYSFQVDGLNDGDIGRSLNNLARLGLLERRDEFPATEENDEFEKSLKPKYEYMCKQMDSPEIKKHMGIGENATPEVLIRRNGLYLNPLGSSFVRVALK